MKRMKELDLHGVLHIEVRDLVENFILLNSKELPLRLITGDSIMMRNLTENILIEHKFGYHTPAYNNGEIIVISDLENIV